MLKSDLNDLIAGKLGDEGKVYWTKDEIDLYIRETECTFGFISQFWKRRLFLDTVVDKNLYDLYTDLLPISQGYIVKDTYDDILKLINIQLMESLSISTPISALYAIDNINEYIDKRLDSFLTHTGLNLGVYEFNTIPGITDYALPTHLVDIVRIAIKDDNNKYYALDKEDEGDLLYFESEYLQSTDRIKYYTRITNSDNVIKLYPKPLNVYKVQVVVIQSRDKSLAVANNGVTFTEKLLLPRNALPYIKWGVSADLLKQDGIGQDLYRSNYCLQRWNEGLIIGKAYTSILTAYINEVPITLESLDNADDFNPEWQDTAQTLDVNNIPTTQIKNLLLPGYNLFFTDITPKVIQSIILDCVVSAPVESLSLDIKEEYVNIFIDYILHLASFKEGFARLNSTNNLLNNFLSLSMNHNYRLKQQGITVEYLLKQTKIQEEQNSRGVNLAIQNSGE
jgi:hypothetical protein